MLNPNKVGSRVESGGLKLPWATSRLRVWVCFVSSSFFDWLLSWPLLLRKYFNDFLVRLRNARRMNSLKHKTFYSYFIHGVKITARFSCVNFSSKFSLLLLASFSFASFSTLSDISLWNCWPIQKRPVVRRSLSLFSFFIFKFKLCSDRNMTEILR
jgi:hypothetical protein